MLAAADRSAEVEFGSRSTEDARDAARALVTSAAARCCVRALAAAERSAALDDGLERTRAAREATAPLVCLVIRLTPERVTRTNSDTE